MINPAQTEFSLALRAQEMEAVKSWLSFRGNDATETLSLPAKEGMLGPYYGSKLTKEPFARAINYCQIRFAFNKFFKLGDVAVLLVNDFF